MKKVNNANRTKRLLVSAQILRQLAQLSIQGSAQNNEEDLCLEEN